MKTPQKKNCRLCQIWRIFGLIAASVVVVTGPAIITLAQPMSQTSTSVLIDGKEKDDLRPAIAVEQKYDWAVYIQFASTRPIADNWWSGIANKLGGRLRVWTTNGSEILSSNPDVKAAMGVPKKMLLSDLYQEVARLNEPQITPFHLKITPNAEAEAYMFQLGKMFPLESNCDYVMEVTPMLYKANVNASNLKSFSDILTNGIATELVEFPPIIAKLETNGNVIPLGSLPWVKGP